MISVKNLCKRFGEHVVVDDLSFDLQEGEIVGFLGPNGAGKSTTMKMLTGFLSNTSGSVHIHGKTFSKSATELKSMIGYLPEGAPAYSDMTVYQFLHFIAQARNIKRNERENAVRLASHKLDLDLVLNKRIENLSKGFKRRVGLAQAIIHDPAILILDEPTDGLDPNQKHQVRQLIEGLSKDKIIIISTHILEEVSALCNRVIVIAHGKKKFDGTQKELIELSEYHNAVTIKLSYLTDISGLLELEGVADMKHYPETNRVTIFPEPGKQILTVVSAFIQSQYMPVDMIFPEQARLDEVFRHITSNDYEPIIKSQKTKEPEKQEQKTKEVEAVGQEGKAKQTDTRKTNAHEEHPQETKDKVSEVKNELFADDGRERKS